MSPDTRQRIVEKHLELLYLAEYTYIFLTNIKVAYPDRNPNLNLFVQEECDKVMDLLSSNFDALSPCTIGSVFSLNLKDIHDGFYIEGQKDYEWLIENGLASRLIALRKSEEFKGLVKRSLTQDDNEKEILKLGITPEKLEAIVEHLILAEGKVPATWLTKLQAIYIEKTLDIARTYFDGHPSRQSQYNSFIKKIDAAAKGITRSDQRVLARRKKQYSAKASEVLTENGGLPDALVRSIVNDYVHPDTANTLASGSMQEQRNADRRYRSSPRSSLYLTLHKAIPLIALASAIAYDMYKD